MMRDYFVLLAPETVLLLGAVVALLSGIARAASVRELTRWIGLGTVLAALAIFGLGRIPDVAEMLPGVRVSLLAWYVRLIALSVGALVMLINLHVPPRPDRAEYYAMILCSLAGVMLTAAADDFVTLFLAIELVSVPTYALVAAGSADVRAQEAGLKYFFLGALAAAVLAYGFSFLYGAGGTMQLSALSGSLVVEGYGLVGLMLVIGGLAYKIAAVPYHVYAPDVYQGAASPITGLLGFFPKAAGFVALIRILALTTPFESGAEWPSLWVPPAKLFWLLWMMAAAAMTVGNCLALMQTNVKRILAYSSIAHTGYMLIGVLVGPAATGGAIRDGWAAVMLYIFAYGVMNLGAFGVLAYLRMHERPVEELNDLSGIARLHPTAALAMAFCVFSLMGMPPTIGFFGKVCLFSGALSIPDGHPHQLAMTVLAVVGVVNSAIAAAYYLRIIGTCYLRDPKEITTGVADRPLRLGLALCSAFVLLVGMWPRDVFRLAGQATSDLKPHVRAQWAGEPDSEAAERSADATSQSGPPSASPPAPADESPAVAASVNAGPPSHTP